MSSRHGLISRARITPPARAGIPTRRNRRRLTAAAVTTLALALAGCGGGSSGSATASSGTGAAGSSSGGQDLQLIQAGTLRVGTLTDAPPNVYLKDGKFTGFDNDLLSAVAAKLNLKVEFVGTDFSGLLAQVKSGKFDVGSSSITITEARKKTVAFTNGYDFGYFGLDVPAGSPITSFDQLTGKRVVVVQGTVQDDYATKQGLNPVRVPDYNSAVNQLKAGTVQAWVSPAEIGEKLAKQSGGKITLAATQISPAPTAFAVAQDHTALREALDKGLDQVIQDGTWTRLQEQYYPGRAVPADFKPGSGTVTFPPVTGATASPSPAGASSSSGAPSPGTSAAASATATSSS